VIRVSSGSAGVLMLMPVVDGRVPDGDTGCLVTP
jgi:hypothetical protein